jgi:ABC-type polysaccharide/polyol phosphate transport system ATPase subunit
MNGACTSMPLFSARALEPIQTGRACWQQISFSLHKGDRLGLVAPSGAGKTLLLRWLSETERACVFTSHDPDQIERFCNRVLALP